MVQFKITLRDPGTQLYFNGLLTTLTGRTRLFKSHGLKNCKIYNYEIAVVSRYGNKVFNVPAQAGESYELSF